MANIILESSRGYDVIPMEDQFLKERKIFITGSVNADSMNELIKKLLYLESIDNTKEITIYIDSPGGEVTSGLAAVDIMTIMNSPIKTVCIGTCASMGAILFLAGDERLMMAHGKIMIHDPAFGQGHEMGGKKPHEIQMELDDLNKCKKSLAKIISERTGKTLKQVEKVTMHDAYYDVDEAIEFGLATGLMTSLE